MDIGSLATTAGDGAAYARKSQADVTATDNNATTSKNTGDSATPASQDEAVQISPLGYAAASKTAPAATAKAATATASSDDTSADSSDDASTDDATTPSSATVSDAQNDTGVTESSSDADAKPLQSVVYGALGLGRPDLPPDSNHAYTLGRWLAAGITIGGLISLFI
ncbi:hypothetical protein G3N59_24745 [Paraburkholderia sp. Ac-20340]|uniref:hypothetical protein n=1 Tax=Paraburkholderia sp. Ac-20340 TaxID=2703888 RepID=UPI001980CD58|nr:hypothetical protein [Paraburkholderia sp. Ac-20340]MBN3856595.1 hypothetical protein [Paraburkholderia sp. Ac-20340]